MILRRTDILLAWAGPGAEGRYEASRLSPEDRARAALPRGARALLDWRVSRALKQRWLPACPGAVHTGAALTGATHSLSHSAGHACLALAPAGGRLGVDIERLRPRRLDAAASWAFSESERGWLAGLPPDRALRTFYALWTLKEALIKAGGLDFPADLRRVGLDGDGALRAPEGGWRAATLWRAGGWVVTVAWEVPVATTGAPEGGPVSGLAMPGKSGCADTAPAGPVRSFAVGRGRAAALAEGAGLRWLPALASPDQALLAAACWGPWPAPAIVAARRAGPGAPAPDAWASDPASPA